MESWATVGPPSDASHLRFAIRVRLLWSVMIHTLLTSPMLQTFPIFTLLYEVMSNYDEFEDDEFGEEQDHAQERGEQRLGEGEGEGHFLEIQKDYDNI